jgi:serine/threonine-protein kinase
MPDDEALAAARSRLGHVLRGKYRLDRVLGAGGMAVVYAATHRNTKQFAIKVLHAELSARESIRTRFQREGYVANSVKHPGAVTVLDDDVGEDGSAFIVMELLEGAAVDQLWVEHAQHLPLGLVLSIADALLDVLTAAHTRGIVHRDLKPPNLFLTCDGALKVLDFGIARLLDDGGGPGVTTTSAALGTPAFMAPEQVLGKPGDVDAQTDLWAVGATMFSLLSGEFVHAGTNATHLMINAATKPARSLGSVVDGVPPAIVAVVDRALAFDKMARWASASQMRAALRDACVEATGAPIAPLPKMDVRPEAGGPGKPDTGPTAFAPTVDSSEPVSAPRPSRPRPARRSFTARDAMVIAVAAIALSLGVAVTLHFRRPTGGGPDVPVVSTRGDVQEAFRHAVDSFLDADIEGAERGFAQAVAEEPDQPWSHLGLALTYAMEQRFQEAQIERASALDLVRRERRGDARDQELLELLELLGSTDSSAFAERYARYRAANPGYLLGLQTIAFYATDDGTREQRVGRFEDVLAVDRRHPVTYLTESWLYQKLGDPMAARAALDAGLTRRVTAPWLLDQRGALLLAEGDYEGAKRDFREAMSHNGPQRAMVHYALALLRSGTPEDEALRRQQVASMTAIPDPDMRAEVLCQHAMGLYAVAHVAAADALLQEVLASAGSTKAGTIVRCLLPPTWSDLPLARYDQAEHRLGLLAKLLVRPEMSRDEVRPAEWMFTALEGAVQAETGKLDEADEHLRALADPSVHEALHAFLKSELEARIQMARGQPVRQTPAVASLSLRARAAHLRGRAGERDGDDAASLAGYGALLDMALECSRSDIPLVLTCAPYVADGLARLARLHLARGRRADAAAVVKVFDAIWRTPDADLAPVVMVQAVRGALR